MSESYPFAPHLGHMMLPPDCQGDAIDWSDPATDTPTPRISAPVLNKQKQHRVTSQRRLKPLKKHGMRPAQRRTRYGNRTRRKP